MASMNGTELLEVLPVAVYTTTNDHPSPCRHIPHHQCFRA
jgi:hypothetical protein